MADDSKKQQIEAVRVARLPAEALREREATLLAELDAHGLPSSGIFVEFEQRAIVFQNVGHVILNVPEDQRARSTYVSKFIAAVSAGLFDAALNYLWDETVAELRRRVASYDLSYFFDHAVKNEDRRKQFKTELDLARVEDQELINGAREIELISEIGFKQLDLIRYMRNWASAAHPNQNQIDGLTLIGYLNTCIREVIALPFSPNVIKIKRLLENIKSNALSIEEARETGAFFLELTQEQANALIQGFFGIYTRSESTPGARNNIKQLAPRLWPRVDEETRRGLGVKYAQFIANGQQLERQLASEFLDLVGAHQYAPDNVRIASISTTIENLLNAHRGMNNFYNEPVFARELERVVGDPPNIPSEVEQQYVVALCDVFLTNGYGVAWNADDIYQRLLGTLTSGQGIIAMLSFLERTIASKLQLKVCAERYCSLLTLVAPSLSAPAAKELLADLQSFSGPRDKMREDASIKRKIAAFQTILRT